MSSEAKRQADKDRYVRDGEHIRARRRERYYEDPEAARQATREWQQSHREQAAVKSSEWYYAHRDYALQRDRANRMRREYGLSVDEHVRLELEQDHACAICRRPFELGRAPHVDHDHATGKVRGLLCGSCNRAIGLMSESIARLTAAAAYLAEKKP